MAFIYQLPYFSAVFNPVDSTTYHIGAIIGAPSTVDGVYAMPVPFSGFVRRITFLQLTAGTLGSGETGSLYIRVNATTDYLLTDLLDWAALTRSGNHEFESGVVPLEVNDFVTLKITTPAWTTNPTSVVYSGNIFIEGS